MIDVEKLSGKIVRIMQISNRYNFGVVGVLNFDATSICVSSFVNDKLNYIVFQKEDIARVEIDFDFYTLYLK